MSAVLTIKAPAKINISLRVLGKRTDGFHELETVMVPISLCDELVFRPAEQLSLVCDTEGVPTDESNLVIKAVKLFEKVTGKTVCYEITLKKFIPHGAGLGGGSSDAASTLMALDILYETGLTKDILVDMAASLGSDVPFFLYKSACLCRGRGEIISPIECSLEAPLLLVKPSFSVSTPMAYKSWERSKNITDFDYAPQFYAGIEFFNDLERPVFEKYIFLGKLKMNMLRENGVAVAMMSGSGSTVFALCDSLEVAKKLQGDTKKIDKMLWTCVCVTLC